MVSFEVNILIRKWISGNGSSNLTFLVKFDNCGLKRSREVDGISFVTTIIFSFHSVFVTKVDRAFKVNCHYTETVAKVSQSLNIEDLKTEVIKEQYALPTCKYEILNAEKDGEPVKFARIGDQIFHRWSCTPENEKTNYCMLVHSCSVYDGQGGDHIPVLDSKGCGVDNYILKSLVYVGDLESVQTSNTFKFADKSTLNFNCQIGLLIKDSVFGCLKARPGCGGDDYKIVTAGQVDNQLVTEPMSHYQTGLVDIGGDQYVEATDDKDKVTEYVVEVEPSTRNKPHYEDFATDDQVNYTDVVDTTVVSCLSQI
uniref:ZP domain-containing protein n=1 Tax=Rhabditophanes sp. KR3021 TaxID=114890 RepID=A0AC35TSS6_9BILA